MALGGMAQAWVASGGTEWCYSTKRTRNMFGRVRLVSSRRCLLVSCYGFRRIVVCLLVQVIAVSIEPHAFKRIGWPYL